VSFAYDNDFRVRSVGNGPTNFAYRYDPDGLLTNAGDMTRGEQGQPQK
jgi:hypothetical protein